MKILININILVLMIYISIIAHTARSFSLQSRESIDQIAMEPYLIDEYESKENPLPTKIHILSKKRSSDSAEKYFDWASKTNRPMEYFRGKRSLRFTKKDGYVNNHKKILSAGLPSGLLRQGVWRSGIVGRRRR